MSKEAEAKIQETAEAVVIQSFDQLQAMAEEPTFAEFMLDGKRVRVPCRRLTQGVEEEVRALRRKAQPPFRKELGQHGDYDYTNQAFLAERDRNEKVARSLIVYTGCPLIAAKRPGLVKPEDIHSFVRTVLTENILEVIALTVTAGGMELVDRANFTSTAGSES